MSGFYDSTNQGSSSNAGGGFYNSGGGGGYQQFQQQSSQQQSQQPAFANVSQWQQQPAASSSQSYNTGGQQQQQQQQQQQMTGQQQQQQQQQQAPNFWNPSTTAAMAGLAAQAATGTMSGDAIAQGIFKAGTDVWQSSGFASMVPGFDTTMQALRTYFAVDNRYVKRKIQKVLFPFFSKSWTRMLTEGPDLVNYALPNSDENAPDLYLPLMSLITYCLLCSLLYGTAGEFNPEVIPDVTTKCVMTQILEVLVIRFGFYMMQTPVKLLDLFAFTGYKYLGLTINIFFGMGLGHIRGYGTSGFYVTFLWTASAMAFFMLKTMANNIPIETASEGPKREVMVLAFAVSQAASMWFVSQTKYL